MASLYNIEFKLSELLNQIEENDGEVTEDIENELTITQENFENKIEDYCKAITMYTSDANCCKEEKTRINNIQKVKNNIVLRLKNAILDAVLKFGYNGKSNNKTIELPTRKLYTVNRTNVEEITPRKELLTKYVFDYLNELHKEGILELGVGIDVDGLLASINAIAKADYENADVLGNPPVEEFIPYTINDLYCLKIDITYSSSIFNLLTSKSNICNLVLTENPNSMASNIDKDIAIAINENADNSITIAEITKKPSLVIK